MKKHTTVTVRCDGVFQHMIYDGVVVIGLTKSDIDSRIIGAFSEFDMLRLLNYFYECRIEEAIMKNVEPVILAAFLKAKA